MTNQKFGWIMAAALACPTSVYAADAASDSVSETPDSETIVVTATRAPVSIADAPATVSVIDRETIADQIVGNIKDLIRFEPGVSVRRAPARFGAALGSTGREGNAGFNIRGVGGNRVLILQDGIRLPDGFGFGAQAAGRGDYVDLGLIKSVEILRGPASALYGSDGLSGAVSFVTSDPADLLGPDRSLAAMLRASYDSAAQEFTETGIVTGRSGNISLLASYTRRDGQELDNKGTVGGTGTARTLPNPQTTRSNSLLAKLVWEPSEAHRIRVTADGYDNFLSSNILSGLGFSPFTRRTTTALTGRDTIKRTRISADWRYLGDGLIEEAKLAFYWQKSKNSQFSDERRTPGPSRTRLNTFDNRIFGTSADMRLGFNTGTIQHKVVVGGDLSFTQQQGLRDGTIPPTGETFPTRAFPVTGYTLGGAFIADEIRIGGETLILYPAVRFDIYDLSPENDPLLPGFVSAGQSGSRFSPKFGAVFNFTDEIGLFGNYAKGFKAPTPTQVNQFFQNLIFGYTSRPNPNLRPETNESIEGGIRFNNDIVSASFTVFSSRYRDFISQTRVGGSFRPGDLAIFQFVNLGRVNISGYEGKARVKIVDGLTGNVAFSYANGNEISATGTRTPLQSVDPFKFVVGLGYRAPSDRFGGQILATHSARKSRDRTSCSGRTGSAECLRPASFTILDANIFYRIGENLTLRAALNNITDAKYSWWSDVAGRLQSSADADAFTQPGRNIRLSVTAKF